MAFSDLVQQKTGWVVGTTLVLTMTNNLTPGGLWVVMSDSRDASQTKPAGWSIAANHNHDTQADVITVYYKVISENESKTVTLNHPSSNQYLIGIAMEFEGPFNANPVGAPYAGNDSGISSVDSLASGATGATGFIEGLFVGGWGMRSGTSANDFNLVSLGDGLTHNIVVEPTSGNFREFAAAMYRHHDGYSSQNLDFNAEWTVSNPGSAHCVVGYFEKGDGGYIPPPAGSTGRALRTGIRSPMRKGLSGG